MDAHTPDPIAVRPNEAARLAGLSRRSIEHLIANGSLPSRRVGRARLILLADLRRLLRGDVPHITGAPAADEAAQ